jgi:hypothetical protein
MLAAIYGGATHFFGLALDAAQEVEDRVVAEIAAAPRGIREGDTLYVANLPVIAHYARLGVEERLGVRGLRMAALTWSPRLLGVAGTSELKRVDERTLEAWIGEDRYFGEPLGLLARTASGRADVLAEDEQRRGPGFSVSVAGADERGIRGLRFVFDRPLDSAGAHVFWGSQTRWAHEVGGE